MMIADTDVLIDYLAGKGEADAVEWLLSRGALKTTVISRFGLLLSNGDALLTRNRRHFEWVLG